jgi:hypothetical protein
VLLQRERARVADLDAQLRAASQAQAEDHARQSADKAELAQRTRQMTQRFREQEQRAREADARVRELQFQLAEAQRTAATLSAVQPAASAAVASPAQTKAWLAAVSDADTIKAQAARIRLQMEGRYGALAQQLGLSSKQIEQFIQLLVDKQMVAGDATVAGLQEGGDALKDPSAFATLVAVSRSDLEAQIRALLGDAGYSQYLQLQVATGQSGTLARMQAALNGSERLSDTQLAQLQQLLADNRIGHLTPKIVATAQAQGFLTPTQLEALQNLFQEQQAAQQSRRAPQPPPQTSGSK